MMDDYYDDGATLQWILRGYYAWHGRILGLVSGSVLYCKGCVVYELRCFCVVGS